MDGLLEIYLANIGGAFDFNILGEHQEIVDFLTEKNVAKDQKPDETD